MPKNAGAGKNKNTHHRKKDNRYPMPAVNASLNHHGNCKQKYNCRKYI